MILDQKKGESLYEWEARLSWHVMVADIGMCVCGLVFILLLASFAFF